MHVDRYTKELQKAYCKVLLAGQGKLTKEIYDRINAGDEETIRRVYIEQQHNIRRCAESIENATDRQICLTQIESIQEVLDALPSILAA